MPRKLGLLLLVLTFLSATFMMAQDAVVKVHVEPEEAFIFVDAQPVGEGMHVLTLSPGHHTIGVYNYGFKPMVKEVTLTPGNGNEDLRFYLEAAGGPVSGPWGVIQIEGLGRAAVLLNGKEPEYFVGHGDEFNNHIWWKQQLIVPVGTHYLTLNSKGRELWSGKLEVPANKRVIIDFNHNAQVTVKDWVEGERMSSLPRFKAGTASATVAVAPVTGTFTASPKAINCNDKVTLAWNTTETLHTLIQSDSENFSELPMSGRETVSPKHTTTYNFKTSGPGGIIESAEAVEVNPVVKADLNSSPEDVHYLRIGDKIITQDHATLTWNVTNADKVTLEPFGEVGAVGTNTVSPTPNDNATGAINETRSYKLAASNVCGGSDAKIATVHLVGNVEPAIASLFFPTGYPDKGHPKKGLVKSQQARLTTIATVFKLYMEHEPNAKLQLVGYADPRGHRKSNQKLSARRAMIVKDFLVAQGIPADHIMLQIKGEMSPLDRNTVKLLEAQNPEPAPVARAKRARATRLAYDRRVDVAIQPIATESVRFFPHAADDSALLFNPRWLGQSKIHKASE